MSDTQWKSADTTNNPNTVAVGIVNQLNRQFITSGVEFVIQVGDLTDNGSNAALDTRAAGVRPLEPGLLARDIRRRSCYARGMGGHQL